MRLAQRTNLAMENIEGFKPTVSYFIFQRVDGPKNIEHLSFDKLALHHYVLKSEEACGGFT